MNDQDIESAAWAAVEDAEADAALQAQLDIDQGIDWEDEDAANEALYGPGRRPLRAYLMKPGELDRLPPVRWLIEGILPQDTLAVLFAEPGAGKTFVAIDWAASLSVDRPDWQEFALRPDTRVLYILAEGAGGLKGRRDAWQGHHGLTMGDNLTFLVRSVDFMSLAGWKDEDESDYDQLVSIVEELQPNLIIVDTMSRAIPGVDENDQAAMSMLFHKADALREAGDHATVLFLHHTNRGGKYRGSSVIHGQVDTMLEIDEESVLRVKKQKDGIEPVVGRVELVPVEGTESVVPVYHSVVAEPDTDTMKRGTVLALLSTAPATFTALHQSLGGGKDSLRSLLQGMVSEGVLKVRPVGQAKEYSLA